MKRLLKSRIFAFLLGALIFSGLTAVSAYSLFANQVGFTPTDTTWKKENGDNITNIEEALNELYSLGNRSLSLTTNGWTTYGGTGYVDGTGHAENVLSNLTVNKQYFIQLLGGMEVNTYTNNIAVSFEGATCNQVSLKKDYAGTKLQSNKYAEWYSGLYKCDVTSQTLKVTVNNSDNYWMWFYSSAYKIYD